jgi:hypothetical protein
MIVDIQSFLEFNDIPELKFLTTSTGRLMCVTAMPKGMPQLFVDSAIKDPNDINAIWPGHPKDENGELILDKDIMILGKTKMKDTGFVVKRK